MEAFLKEFEVEHLKQFNLEEIRLITRDFDSNKVIGGGGFGKVYQGVLTDSKGEYMVAFKRLDKKFGQGDPEFLKEIFMLSSYMHENLISLIGFCDQDGEKILVYEYASHGSLDHHLSSTSLTWTQRLKICLGAARGLCYLHDPRETQQRVIHRDIKSANILLNENWIAKVSDMGLSKLGPANQPHTFLATNVVGTFIYIDPIYMETSILTKESDVYSFGVVLFEVLCGRLCYENNNNHFQSFVRSWKKSYKENKLDEIIFHDLKQSMDMRSLEIFSEIAYQCLHKSRAERPMMSLVVEKLEIALGFQQEISKMEEFGKMVKSTVKKEELEMLLYNGIIINGGNTWFSLNKNGEHCEMISAECFIPTSSGYYTDYVPFDGQNKSRFEVHNRNGLYHTFNAHVRTQFLSPHITYKVNLVFKFVYKRDSIGITYALASETKYLISFVAHERGDGWFRAELYQLNNGKSNVDLEIRFSCDNPIEVEGIEFLPMEKVQPELLLEDKDVALQTDTYWEQNLPSDYEDIIKLSKCSLQWTTKKELYFIFCKGFPINAGEEWFFLAKNGKKGHMLSAKRIFNSKLQWEWQSLPESRFGKVAFDPVNSFRIDCRSNILSPQTTYATYLVYKLQENHSWFKPPVVCQHDTYYHYSWYIYLLSPQASVITGKVYQNKGFPQQRDDGWMEVQLYEFQTDNERISTDFQLRLSDFTSLKGLIVQGIEFKPV